MPTRAVSTTVEYPIVVYFELAGLKNILQGRNEITGDYLGFQ